MVDAVDSKSIAERRGGSSPSWGTIHRMSMTTEEQIARIKCIHDGKNPDEYLPTNKVVCKDGSMTDTVARSMIEPAWKKYLNQH